MAEMLYWILLDFTGVYIEFLSQFDSLLTYI